VSEELNAAGTAPAFTEFTLEGDRFERGRLPLDALAELQRYRDLLLAAAKRAWFRDNPGDDLPQDFVIEFDVAISRVENGSAVSVLERPPSEYGDYFDAGRDTVDAMFAQMVQGLAPADLDPEPGDGEPVLTRDEREAFLDLAGSPSFRDFGATLGPEDKAIFADRHSDIQFTMATRVKVLRPVVKRVREITKGRRHSESVVAGRLISLNAEKRNFTIKTLVFGDVNGRYSDAAKTAELRAVLDSSAQAPVVRIEGKMSWTHRGLEKILDIDSVELFEVESEPWSRRLVELASLPPGWSEADDNEDMISFPALDAAREIIRAVTAEETPFPGISPLEDGGVHVQWVTDDRATSVEIDPDAAVYAHTLHVADLGTESEVQTASDLETSNLEAAINFIREVLR
jgi:hypothetical protein